MSPAVQCLVIVAIVAFFFVTELLPLAVTSMCGCIAVGLAGLIPIKTVFSGLSNSTLDFNPAASQEPYRPRPPYR